MQTSNQKALPVGLNILTQVLGYLKYGRLMVLLMIMGCLLGVCYFMFTPSVYYSRGLIDMKFFALPITSDSIEAISQARAQRNVAGQLGSRQMLAWTAHRLGIGQSTDSYEKLREGPLRKVSVGILDFATLQVDVYSPHPWVVREFPKALVDQYESYYREQRLAWMDVAVKKYQDELVLLKQKIDAKLKGQVDFERTNTITELMIEQNALAQVPVDLLRAQHKLRKYDDVRSVITARRAVGLDPLEELSILENAKTIATEKSTVGQVLPASGDMKDALTHPALAFGLPTAQQVVVQPNMMEGLRAWQQLERDKRTVEKEVEEASRTYLEDHDVMKKLREKLRLINEGLTAELDVERKRFDVDYRRVQQEIVQLETKIPEYAKSTEKLNKLRQEYTLGQEGDLAWSKAYTDLSKLVTTMEFGVDKERVDIRFREFTTLRDEDPVSPTKSKLAMMAMVLAIGLGLGVPFALEQLNDQFTSLEAFEKATGIKGIGVVPKSTPEILENITRPVEDGSKKPNNVLECYRVIRAHLALQAGNKEGAKVIMLTSSRPSEGKTTTCANLAWAFQSSGARTLLVDLDFRRGRVHRLFRETRGPGLCQALTGEMTLEETKRHTPLPLLDYYSRGDTVAGSSELLCRLGLEQAIEEWKHDYDWILLDTPPVLGLSETTSLQRVADGVVMVVKSEITHRRDVVEAIGHIQKAGAKLFGVVLNSVDLSKISNYYNYYYSSAHYYQMFEDEDEGLSQPQTRNAGKPKVRISSTSLK
ncbi:polysaccharide biosynthesis tyrosine autokinase [Verrucomicrobium sp. BvORR106]|uniref:BY-kinase domain-containing protein n=1 Tax=Verrucomicrobium sp. BvORR106 TaxID=1403819 RepID=UPI000571242C|nr:polysaccharide biosynthesis tyrosine autokinase [Verrucomicrobium sp. BvORR106]